MEIVYQDADLIVCIKPAGVLSTDEPGGLPSLVREAMGDEKADVRTVHRLDRVVSGLMVLTRNASAAAALFTPGYVAFLLYSVCMIAMGIAGLVLLILRARKLRFDPAPAELPKGSRFSVSFLNAGMLLFILACLALMVYAAVQVS